MKNTYAITVDGSSGAVTERRLGDHDPGYELARSLTVVNSSVAGGVRTVRLVRPLKGKTSDHFSFDAKAQGVPFIAAVGSSTAFGYHKARSSSTLMLVEVGGPLCVCAGGVSGSIDGVAFSNHCQPQPGR
jgi:hypothetical protein